MNHELPQQAQTAFQLLVDTDWNVLVASQASYWDSGKVHSDASVNVRYAGLPLEERTVYYWKVRVWDKEDKVGAWSDPQKFVTGLWDQWSALPVWASSGRFVFLRHQFVLASQAVSYAIVYITAHPSERLLGGYQLFVNGQWIGVGPGRALQAKHFYDGYDVREALHRDGVNVLGFQCYGVDTQGLLCQLEIMYEDGSRQTITSGIDWKGYNADSVFNPDGCNIPAYYCQPHESIDANALPSDWTSPSFDDSGWDSAIMGHSFSNLTAKSTYSVVLGKRNPGRLVRTAPGHLFFDFDREIMGGIELELDNDAEQYIIVRLGEELIADNMILSPLRTANLFEDVWKLRRGHQILRHHEYMQFRYGEILGLDQMLDQKNLHAWVVGYPFSDTESTFTSSNLVLNDVWDFCKYTIKATTLDLYTDTNTRERGVYEADAYITALSHYSTTREFAIQRHTLEYLLENPTWPTEWRILTVFLAYADFMATGDITFLQQCYPKLKENTLQQFINTDYLLEKPTLYDELPVRIEDIVDWPPVMRDDFEFTSINTVVNCYVCRALQLLAIIASKLGKSDDAVSLRTKHEKMKNAINTHLFDGELYIDGKTSQHRSLHANMFALAFDITPKQYQHRVAEYLIKRGMVCSVYGAQFLLEALYNAGEAQVSLDLLTAVDGNSWGDMLYNRGATTTTESWNTEQKSNMSWSHPWATAPANIIARKLMGVEPLEPGYAKIRIKPQVATTIQSASIQVPSLRGTISVAVEQSSESFQLQIHVPANIKAIVYVPKLGASHAWVTVDGLLHEGIIEDDFVCIDDVDSGEHIFIRSQRQMFLPVVNGEYVE